MLPYTVARDVCTSIVNIMHWIVYCVHAQRVLRQAVKICRYKIVITVSYFLAVLSMFPVCQVV